MDSHSASTSTESAKNLNSADSGNSTNNGQNVWSDKKCVQIAFEKSFPKAVKNLTVQKNIITRFFNFYLGAKIHKQKGISVSDLVFSVISITPLHLKTEQFMWTDNHYNNEGSLFSLALEDKLYLQDNVEVNKKFEKETVKIEEADQQNEEETQIMVNNGVKSDGNPENKENGTKTNAKSDRVCTEHLTKTEQDNLKFVDKDATKNQESNVPLTKHEEDKVTIKFPIKSDIIWFTKKITSSDVKAEYKQYGPVENAAFTASMNKYLDIWDSSQEARIALKYFFGFVALTLLRGTTKTFKHLVNAFSNVKFVRYLDNVRAFQLQYLKYSVPHKRCIKCCYRTFRKRDENLRVMFAKIVINSFYIDVQSQEANSSFDDWFPPNIVKVTVLTHTAGYGLGLISMIENLAKRTFDLELLFESTRCKETEPYWKKIISFFEKYMVKDANEHTHYWARVIDGSYFKDLSCAENYPLAVILAVFIEKLTNGCDAGIWQATWTTKGENLEDYKKIGLNLYGQYRENMKKNISNFASKMHEDFNLKFEELLKEFNKNK